MSMSQVSPNVSTAGTTARPTLSSLPAIPGNSSTVHPEMDESEALPCGELEDEEEEEDVDEPCVSALQLMGRNEYGFEAEEEEIF